MSENNEALILAVDDERANLSLLQRILGKQYRLMCVSDGAAAFDLLAQAAFDVVLLDIMMPNMSGLEVLTAMRSSEKYADIPVILISALTDADDIARGLEMGANDYITKPIDFQVTLARVRTQLRLKALEDERKQTIAKLSEAQQMKENLLRIASHDLKNPLTNLCLVAALLRETNLLDDGHSHLLEAMESSLDAMHTVVTDFLDTAALQTSSLDLRLKEVDVQKLVNKLIQPYHVAAGRKNITLEIGELEGVIYADDRRFAQALGNLISNAVKYSPPNKVVHLWTECSEHSVRIFVADQGPGVPPEERNRLFTQFGKLSPRPTAGESSTGLGLWIVKHLITLQSGTVGADFADEGGSVFWLEMPLVQPEYS